MVEALDMMSKKFTNLYIIYCPIVSCNGMPFPVNRAVCNIQEEVNKGRCVSEDHLGTTDDHYMQMMDASMADFPILKSYLTTRCHEPEQDFVTIGNSSKTLRFSLAKITNTTQENF